MQFPFSRVTAGCDKALVFVNVGNLTTLFPPSAANMGGILYVHQEDSTNRPKCMPYVRARDSGCIVFMTSKVQGLYEACFNRLVEVYMQQFGMTFIFLSLVD